MYINNGQKSLSLSLVSPESHCDAACLTVGVSTSSIMWTSTMGCSDVNTTHTDIFIITLAPGTLPSPRHNYINNTVGTSHTSHMATYILPFSYVGARGEDCRGNFTFYMDILFNFSPDCSSGIQCKIGISCRNTHYPVRTVQCSGAREDRGAVDQFP